MPDAGWRSIWVTVMSRSELAGVVLIGAYSLLLVAANYFYVVRRRRADARAEIRITRDRFLAPTGAGMDAHTPRFEGGLVSGDVVGIGELLVEAEKALKAGSVAAVFALDSAPELAAWKLIHRAVVSGVRHVESDDAVKARILRAYGQLDELTGEAREVWRTRLKSLLDERPDDAGRREALAAFLSELYEQREELDARFARVAKMAVWSTFVCLLLLTPLVISGTGLVLFAGAVGGLLGRLARFRNARWATREAEVAWAQLFLAPPVGALSAWGGIYLLAALVSVADPTPIHGAFDPHTHEPRVLGFAVALGFSERLFDQLVSSAADQIASEGMPTKPDSGS
jgi:hypothetical protein